MIQIALLTAALALGQAPKAPAKTAAPKEAPVPAEDPAPDKSKLRLISDGKQHFFAIQFKEPEKGGIPERVWWSADGKDFYRLRSPGGGAEGDKSFDIVLWDPRLGGGGNGSGLSFREGKYTTNCGDKKVDFQLVPADQAKAVLEGANFKKSRWTRQAYALARDEKGTYYYVDRHRDDDDRSDRPRDFRLFVGPRGKMKEQQMTNLVSDSEGDIFGTKAGDFRLVLNKEKQKESKWVTGAKETRLTSVPLYENAQVIYNDLGVYERAKLGTPCDEF